MPNQNSSQRSNWLGIILGIGAIGLISIILSHSFFAMPFSSSLEGTPSETFEQGEAEKATRNAEERATLRAASTEDPVLLTPFYKETFTPPTEQPPAPIKYLQRVAGNGRIIEGANITHLKNTIGFIPTNIWIEKTDTKYIVVYAGEKMNLSDGFRSENQGVLIIEWRSLDTPNLAPGENISGGGVFITPQKVGAVFVENAIGEQLIVRSMDGSVFVFDVVSQQFATQNVFDPYQRQVGEGTLSDAKDVAFEQNGLMFWHRWHQSVDAGNIEIFTGVENLINGDFSSGEGVVVIGPLTNNAQPEVFYAPEARGLLRIFDITSTHVVLVDTVGKVFVFDFMAQEFLESSKMDLPFAPLFEN